MVAKDLKYEPRFLGFTHDQTVVESIYQKSTSILVFLSHRSYFFNNLKQNQIPSWQQQVTQTAMFRKVKKGDKAKAGMRRRRSTDDNDDDNNNNPTNQDPEESTAALLSEARKRTKIIGERGSASTSTSTAKRDEEEKSIMHAYDTTTEESRKRKEELVTSTVEIHAKNQSSQMQGGAAERGDDGIFRDKTRSKLLAGPIKAASHIRTTCRFDYQPGEYSSYHSVLVCRVSLYFCISHTCSYTINSLRIHIFRYLQGL